MDGEREQTQTLKMVNAQITKVTCAGVTLWFVSTKIKDGNVTNVYKERKLKNLLKVQTKWVNEQDDQLKNLKKTSDVEGDDVPGHKILHYH